MRFSKYSKVENDSYKKKYIAGIILINYVLSIGSVQKEEDKHLTFFAKDFIIGLLLYVHSLLKNQNYSSSPIFIPLIILFKHTELISFDSMNVSNQSFSAC